MAGSTVVTFRALGLLLGLLATHCGAEPATDAGRRPEEPPPERIVVIAPAAAEMLDALGEIDRVVGVGDFVDEPRSIAGLPQVGSYDVPNIEQVLSLRANLVITTSSQAAAASHRKLESLGIAVLALDTSTYEGVFRSLADTGRMVGRQDEAGTLERRMRESLRAIRKRAEEAPMRRVLFVVGRDPVYVAGPGSHIDEMMAMAGGTNVAHDLNAPYQRLSMEAVLERMPDIIIDTSDNRPDAPRGRVAGDWGEWTFLPAVHENRVYRVDPSRLVIPGIRLPEMTLLMGKLIHPEIFGEPLDEELRGTAASVGGAPG